MFNFSDDVEKRIEELSDKVFNYEIVGERTEFVASFENKKDLNQALKALKELNKEGDFLTKFEKQGTTLKFVMDMEEVDNLDLQPDELADLSAYIGLILISYNVKSFLLTHKSLTIK